jgi:hypothetical protein
MPGLHVGRLVAPRLGILAGTGLSDQHADARNAAHLPCRITARAKKSMGGTETGSLQLIERPAS